MGLYLVLVTYFGIAAYTAGYVFYHGLATWRPPVVVGPAERTTLLLVCLIVGVAWVLFVPGLVALTLHNASGRFELDPRAWDLPWTRPARIKA